MSISMIAAIGRNNELGRGNDLIWHFREDMKFFKEMTTGNTVIMGRKTFESLAHALPNRRNIVITSNPHYKADDAETAAGVDDALALAKNDTVFIIGGGRIYSQFLPFADTLYLTEIEDECADADVFFPDFEKSKYTAKKLAEYETDGISFSHVKYSLK